VKTQSRLPLLLILLTLSGCGSDEVREPPRLTVDAGGTDPGAVSRPLTITDASGDEVTLASIPKRILCLVPSGTETLVSLGARDLLVGRTDFDTASALRELPSVGGGLHANVEAILALKPDLVITFAGDSDPDTPAALARLGVPHMAIAPNRIRDVRDIILDLGIITGRGARAEDLLAHMDLTLSEIRKRVGSLPRIRVAYLLGGTPPWVAGPGSYIDELIDIAGGQNVFSDLDVRYGPVNTELFLDRAIDLLLAARGSDFSIPETRTPVRRVPPGIEIPGPALAAAVMEMAQAIHPEAFR